VGSVEAAALSSHTTLISKACVLPSLAILPSFFYSAVRKYANATGGLEMAMVGALVNPKALARSA
jgi:hypothetical protein